MSLIHVFEKYFTWWWKSFYWKTCVLFISDLCCRYMINLRLTFLLAYDFNIRNFIRLKINLYKDFIIFYLFRFIIEMWLLQYINYRIFKLLAFSGPDLCFVVFVRDTDVDKTIIDSVCWVMNYCNELLSIWMLHYRTLNNRMIIWSNTGL